MYMATNKATARGYRKAAKKGIISRSQLVAPGIISRIRYQKVRGISSINFPYSTKMLGWAHILYK